MDLELKGKIALVTGGSRGIGRAIALALAREGADVTLSYASNEDAAKESVDAILSAGGRASSIKFDVGDAEASQTAVETLIKEKGSLHILVNNAGVALDGLLLRYKNKDLERSFRTNVFGPYVLAKAATRAMMKAKWGRVIMMGSVVAAMGNAGQSAYGATKAALEGMVHSLARELASRGITANLVAPGFIDTDMTKDLSESMKTSLLDSIPLGRMGTADEIADTVAFLASERARYLTGQVVHVNGGLYA